MLDYGPWDLTLLPGKITCYLLRNVKYHFQLKRAKTFNKSDSISVSFVLGMYSAGRLRTKFKRSCCLKEVVVSFEQERKIRLNQGAGYQKYKICMWLISIIKMF